MASPSDFPNSQKSRPRWRRVFEGQREVQSRGATVGDSAGLQFQDVGSTGENYNYASKFVLDFEQNVRLRSLHNSCRQKNYDQSIKEKSKQTCCPDCTPVHLTSETFTTNMDSKTLQEIERALEVARKSLGSLKTTEEMLEHLVTEAKQEENKIAEVINNKFADFITSLNSRKRKLQTELVMNTCNFITDVHNVQMSVMQKSSDLEGAIKIAKELKAKSSLKACHNLSQVLCNLKITPEDEILKVDNLKKRKLPRFYIDYDEIISLLRNMGKFSLDMPNPNVFGDFRLKISNMEDELSGNLSKLNREHRKFVEEMATVTALQEADSYSEGSYTLFQETAVSPTQKCIAFPYAASTPDVIIEEIIEDDQEMSSTENPEDAHPKNVVQKLTPFGPKADTPELVFVSCVINPCHFYVRTLSEKKMAVRLEKALRQFCYQTTSSPRDILELGTIIFVRSKEHGVWCRAKIFELIPAQNINEGKPCGPTKYKICDIAMMQVFLIDFGHSEVLIASGVADEMVVNPDHATLEYIVMEDLCSVVRKPDLHIEAQLRGINKLALHCSLKDIVPKHSSEGWSRAARTQFLRMVNKKAVLMKVFREQDGVLIVDLMKPPANKISSDMPVSLRDALVFLDLARFRTEHSDQLENIVPLQFWSPVIPQENTEVTVVVSHINSLDDFYLQLLEQGPDFAVLLNKVEEVYKNPSGDNLEILCPIQGQPCIARFEDGVWYRAQVIGLPGHQEVEVKYVDFGNTAKINVKDMRKIKDDFLACPAKAIRCKLANIEPYKGAKEWSSKSKDRFEELVRDKCMLCFIIQKFQDNVLSVELYTSVHISPEQSCSINSLLVKEDLASYTTSNTKIIIRSPSEVWDPTLEEIFKTEIEVLKPGYIDLSQMEDFGLVCNKELQVRISHVVSPSKIFAQLLSSEKNLKSLQEKMMAIYSESGNETVQWKIDMNCAAYVNDTNEWMRGQICRIVSENIVEVFFFDFGLVKTMNTNSLRTLEENLKTDKPLAMELSLTDIRPAGGTNQWTATACDVLQRYLTGAVVNIIIQENSSSPLAVKIFGKDGGLYTDISEHMIKEGLAFRKKRAYKAASSTVAPEMPQKIPCQQKNVDVSDLLAKIECTPSPSVPEKEADLSVTKCEEQDLELPVAHPRTVDVYKPPAIPGSDHFSALVSCVSDNGTIYVRPKSQDEMLTKLMNDIQSNFKCLGLLEPYSWQKGEACVVRAADTMWYRGEVIEVGGGIIRVRYLDYGYIEKIPQCHLYPTVLYAEIPPFSIPCQLYKTLPVGGVWQQDAVELLQELLTKRLVEVQIMEQPGDPWGNLSIKLCFDGMSLSSFMAYHKHCIDEDYDGNIPKLDIANCSEDQLEENCEISHEELLLSEADTPLLPPYTMPSLPVLGELFPVRVKHMVSPNEVYLVIDQRDNCEQLDGIKDSGSNWNSESENLDQALQLCNDSIQSYPPLTDFRKDMPCLAEYSDGLWYRGKLLYIKEFNPLSVIVEFVDYGASERLSTSRLRQIPPYLMRYPAQAFKVLLAGFKPASYNSETKRIPYCPEWSTESLWAMREYLSVKQLYASSLTHSPEHTVFLYEDGHLVHLKLVEKGLAKLA
ncbi:RING finger protein 17 isoform X2 [Hemicordylus capensis]|uniref:RING finger protein 17 isoform X2 n=1 Tax=Hemicordylus capensis TaxID=884348 RepID=UPI0023028336|nr:RING finger protein 17 isoform X2 [Hemicordylus capensis]